MTLKGPTLATKITTVRTDRYSQKNQQMDYRLVQMKLFGKCEEHPCMTKVQGWKDNGSENATTLNSSEELECRVMHTVTAPRSWVAIPRSDRKCLIRNEPVRTITDKWGSRDL